MLLLLLLPLLHGGGVHAQDFNSTAEAPSRWIVGNIVPSVNNGDYVFRTVLRTPATAASSSDVVHGECGFLSRSGREDASRARRYVFGVVLASGNGVRSSLQLVWSANRERAVGEGASLELRGDGGLLLRDSDGSLAWTTNASSVVGVKFTGDGNLLLHGENESTVVWQSSDHPTDALLSGQKLRKGQTLVSNVDDFDATPGLFYLSNDYPQLRAVYNTSPPQPYFYIDAQSPLSYPFADYIYYNQSGLSFPKSSLSKFMRLDHDGHLNVYQWDGSIFRWSWHTVNLFATCGYPTICGTYGICNEDDRNSCSCPSSADFGPASAVDPSDGCVPAVNLSCRDSKHHHLIQLQNISYFNFHSESASILGTKDRDSCTQACLRNCSCRAAIFLRNASDAATGFCALQSHIFSLRYGLKMRSLDYHSSRPLLDYNLTTAFLKVQRRPTQPPTKVLVGSIVGSSLAALFLVVVAATIYVRKRRAREEEEDLLRELPRLPTKFSHKELTEATESFSRKLGEGGFGSVFQGMLQDGRRVAVKRLESVTQGRREFLAEVATIGGIQHLHLVNLIGFCAEKSHRLLVYEFMSNGSLDGWIFRGTSGHELSWDVRRRIVGQVAAALRYLHEECIHKIAHLDVKPHNILLNDAFDAKVSDFGLSKLIDRNESCVVTIMRGTPGYLAPEWLTSVITEKVDVYSFGVVLAETVCGRRNFDRSQPEESAFLLNEIKDKAVDGHLSDIIGKYCAGIDVDEEDALGLLGLAIWCVHTDHNKRPSMSLVVKVLEGTASVDLNLDFDISTFAGRKKASSSVDSTRPSASILSGPR